MSHPPGRDSVSSIGSMPAAGAMSARRPARSASLATTSASVMFSHGQPGSACSSISRRVWSRALIVSVMSSPQVGSTPSAAPLNTWVSSSVCQSSGCRT
jgi:hypothetical protein